MANISAADESGTVNLAWDANRETDIAGYRVHYGTASGNYSWSQAVGTSPAATLADLEPGTLYYCAVQAVNTSELESPLSTEISFIVPEATFPEISVEQSTGSVLLDGQGDVTLSKVDLGSTGPAETFFIKNLGTSDLTGLAITADGEEFTLAPLSTSTLAPGEITSFNVTFRPAAAGIRATVIHIRSNEAGENSFDISLLARGVAVPEISIQSPVGSDLSDSAATAHFNNSLPGTASVAETFTITNTGTADLTGLAISADGTAGGDFILGQPAVSILAPGASTTFTIAFSPTLSGLRTATLHVASNDPDENPFAIDLSGSGVADPEIAIRDATATDLVDGAAAINFSGVNLGSTSAAETFTIRNLGTANLTGIAVVAAGDHGSNFTVTAPAVTALAPGASTTFTVAFMPTAAGARSATLHIASSDGDESPFAIHLSGNGVAFPLMALENADGTAVATSGAVIQFGGVTVGATGDPAAYTVRNTGTSTLTGLQVTITGAEDSSFVLAAPATTSLAPGAATTFSVNFRPTTGGPKGAVIHIASDSTAAGPLVIGLNGNGIGTPEIVVEQSGWKNLADGNAFINFGTVNVGTTANAQTFTIRNSGTATLAGLTLVKNGINPADFTVTALNTKSLAPGASTTFKVFFKPTKIGTRWSAIHLTSNDADETPFDIILTGTGKKSGTTTAGSAAASPYQGGKPVPPVKGTAVIDGKKFRTLTITKTAGTTILPRDIEVSSDLVDWASGKQHTTVLLNTAKTLKVRDNTPITQDAKRHIRLKR